MGMLPPVVVELKALSGELTAKVQAAKAELAGLEAQGAGTMTRLGSVGKFAAAGIAVIGTAAIAAGVGATMMATKFQESTTQLITGAGESQKNIEMVRQGILNMAGAVGTMPIELSKGMYLIESAGYHGAAGLSVLKAAAQGAKVGGADMTVVANGLTTAMTDYNIPASRANAVTSALVTTVAAGKMKMGDLASSLGMVMPKAAALGVSFQDVTGAMATMTAGGMSARRASMNLSNTIMALGAPSKAAQKSLEGIGLTGQQVKDSLSTKGLAGTLAMITEHVGTKFPKGSVASVTALKNILGGTTGYGTALLLTGTHAKSFEANVKGIGSALNGQNSEVKGFAETQKDLAFQFDAGKAKVAAMGITLGNALLPAVTKVMSFINGTALPAISGLISSFLNGTGAAGKIEDALTAFWNNALVPLAGFLTGTILPGVHALIEAFKAGGSDITSSGFAGVMERIGLAARAVADFVVNNVVPALAALGGFIIGTLVPGLASFAGFLSDNAGTIGIIAGVIVAVMIPALVLMAVQAAISGAETVAVWLMIQASAIASTASSVVQFVIQGAKWVWLGIMAMANAAVIAAAWLISMGPIGLVIAAVVALGVLIATHMDLIKGWISAAWTWIQTTTATVWGAISSFFTGLWDSITSGISTAWNAVVGFVSGVVDSITGFISNLATMAVTILGWITYPYRIAIAITIGLFNLLATGVMVVVNTLVGWVVAGWNKMWTLVAPIINTMKAGILAVWNAISAAISTVVNAVWGFVSAAFTKISSTVSTIMNTVKAVISSEWNAISSTVSTVVNAVWGFVSGAFTKISSTVSSIMGTVKGVLSSAWSSISGTISGVVGTIYGVVSGAFGRIVGAISGAAAGAIGAARTLITNVVNAIKSGIGSMASIGSSIVSGLINGITGAAGRLWSAITSFIANNVPAPVRKLLGLASPSKLFAEFGSNTVQGFIVGVEGKKGDLASTMKALIPGPGGVTLNVGAMGSLASANGPSGGLAGIGGAAAVAPSGADNGDVVAALAALGDRIDKIMHAQTRAAQTMQRTR